MRVRSEILSALIFILVNFIASSCIDFNASGAKKMKHIGSAIFLHHSTGGLIYNQDGAKTNVPIEVRKYNSSNNLHGNDSLSLDESAWPTESMGWNNEWFRWHNIIDGMDKIEVYGFKKFLPFKPDANKAWNDYLEKYETLIIKSCYPSSAMKNGTDTSRKNLQEKTLENYKTLWRSIVKKLSEKKNNFFVIWTNAPLVQKKTTEEAAAISMQFCRWAKDTLAAGLDSEIGKFPENIYVFDYFSLVADTNGFLRQDFAASPTNSHPNISATEFVAPIFVNETFNAIRSSRKKK
jgi:hypothetical protein